MKTIDERAKEFAKEYESMPCLAKHAKEVERAYKLGATAQQEIDINKALTAYCEVECQRKPDMPCAHLADGGCINFRKFKQLIEGGKL